MPPQTFLLWLFLVWSFGWLALPVARRIFRHGNAPLLPDGGVAAGRMLLLVLWTLSAFWLGHARVPVRFSALLIFPILLFLLWRWWKEKVELIALVRSQKRGLIAGELIFFSVFLFFFVLRGFWPSIENGEKPMDMALISACARADFLPPPNPYAAGERLASYYYFGHLQTALLTDAIGAEPRWTYNLMAATLPALCFTLLASLAGALIGRVRYGAIAAFIVLACGTQEPWRQWLTKWNEAHQEGRPFQWWPINYWDTSRVIPFIEKENYHFTINEYPWFTFNYADLHAHYFAQPLALLILSLSWALYHQVSDGAKAKRWKITALLSALALGAQIVTNTWDFPAYALLICFCVASLAFWPGWKSEFKDAALQWKSRLAIAAGAACGIGFTSLLVAVPFLTKLHSEANPPQRLEQPASPLTEWLLVWGVFSAGWLFTLFSDARRRKAKLWPLALTGVMLFVVCWLLSDAPAYVLSLLLILIYWNLVSSLSSDDATHVFLCRVALCGLLALLWSETTWAGFLGPPYHRQDTVFKFGLQGWYLLGTAAICGGLRLWAQWRASFAEAPPLRLEVTRVTLFIVFFAPLVAMAATPLARARAEFIDRGRLQSEYETVYVPEAKPVVFGFTSFGFRAERWDGWDAWAHLKPAERKAAQWLYDMARDGDYLLEAEQKEGGDYTEFTRYAHATGVPTLIGPQAHTFQWGTPWEKVFERKNDARVFYLSGGLGRSAERAVITQKYQIRFVICGELERKEYGAANLANLERDLINDEWHSATFEDTDEDPHRVTIYFLK